LVDAAIVQIRSEYDSFSPDPSWLEIPPHNKQSVFNALSPINRRHRIDIRIMSSQAQVQGLNTYKFLLNVYLYYCSAKTCLSAVETDMVFQSNSQMGMVLSYRLWQSLWTQFCPFSFVWAYYLKVYRILKIQDWMDTFDCIWISGAFLSYISWSSQRQPGNVRLDIGSICNSFIPLQGALMVLWDVLKGV